MRHTDKTKSRLSKSRKGKNNPFYGRKHTEASKEKMRRWSREKNNSRKYDLSPMSIVIPEGNTLAYISGIIDADGSIRFSKNRPFVAIYNSSKPLMDWACETIGATISAVDKRGRVPGYTWRISASKDVYHLCKAMLPLLIVKKEDCQKVIDFLEDKYGLEKLNS